MVWVIISWIVAGLISAILFTIADTKFNKEDAYLGDFLFEILFGYITFIMSIYYLIDAANKKPLFKAKK